MKKKLSIIMGKILVLMKRIIKLSTMAMKESIVNLLNLMIMKRLMISKIEKKKK